LIGATKRNKIAINNRLLSTDKTTVLNNNKLIHFNNRKPENLIDFHFLRWKKRIAKPIRYHSQIVSMKTQNTLKPNKNTESRDRSFTSQGKLETKQTS
jgi:hypothetical protein